MGQANTNQASQSNSSGTNNLTPILFHDVHGDNIQLSWERNIARRVDSFCRGIAFSNRPINITEKVYIKFIEVSNNWSGVIRFGFTSYDPGIHRCNLPKYACPDLTRKSGYWAKALNERFAERDTILYFYVTQTGDVYYGINGEDKGIFLSGIPTSRPLWALFDIYGNSKGIELLEKIPLNNSRRAISRNNNASQSIDAQIVPSLQSLRIQNSNRRPGGLDNQTNVSNVSRYYQTGTELIPFPFHAKGGRNIYLSADRCVATRNVTEFCMGYVFTSRPVQLGEKIIIKILAVEMLYAGALAFGLTSCDPSTLDMSDLPANSEFLLDRPEYWVLKQQVAGRPQVGDELAFSVLPTGEVQFTKNGGSPEVLMHVDQTLQLWAFFELYGSTQKISIMGSIPGQSRNNSVWSASPPWPRLVDPETRRLRINSLYNGESSIGNQVVNGTGIGPAPVQTTQSNGIPQRHFSVPGTASSALPSAHPSASEVDFQPTMGGGTVLVVNLPPAHSNFIDHQQQKQNSTHLPSVSSNSHHSNHVVDNSVSNEFDRLAAPSGTFMSNHNNTCNYLELNSSVSDTLVNSPVSSKESTDIIAGTSSECSICYEGSIDSVLYSCGHMCMCYKCAVQQWRGRGGGHCPLCRAVIKDVIRTYKS